MRRVPPDKKKRILPKYVFIAQKKRPDAMNAMQKPLAFYNVRFLKNQEKPPKITEWLLWLNMGLFMRFFIDYFENHTL